MMAGQWYFFVSSEVHGPVNRAELAKMAGAGEITPNTRVQSGEIVCLAKQLSFLKFAEARSATKPVQILPVPQRTQPPPILPARSTRFRRWLRSHLSNPVFVVASLAVIVLLTIVISLGIFISKDVRQAPPASEAKVAVSRAVPSAAKKVESTPKANWWDEYETVVPAPAATTAPPAVRKPIGPPAKTIASSVPPVRELPQLSPADLYAKASPAVVTITTKAHMGAGIGLGSGFLVAVDDLDLDQQHPLSSESFRERDISEVRINQPPPIGLGKEPMQFGYVLTNWHVLRAATEATITFANGDTGYVFAVRRIDETADLALLRVAVKTKSTLPVICLAQQAPATGRPVYAIGSPKGLQNSFTGGMVSGYREHLGTVWMQMDASISSGSSGGPVLSLDGRVVAVAVASRIGGQNLNFAVSVKSVRRFLHGPYVDDPLWKGVSYTEEQGPALDYSEAAFDDAGSVAKLRQAQDMLFTSPNECIKLSREVLKTGDARLHYYAWFVISQAQHHVASDRVYDHETSLPSHGRQSEVDYNLAYRRNASGRAAINSAKKAIDLQPDFAPAYAHATQCYHCAGMHKDALNAADMLVHLVPRCPDAYLDRADMYCELGNIAAAIDDYRQAARFDPRLEDDNQYAAFLYACSLELAGKVSEAHSAYERADSIPSKHVPYYTGIRCVGGERRCESKMQGGR